MLKDGKGVNAVDASGSSTLMTAIMLKNYELFSAVLNSHYPKPNYDYHKPVRLSVSSFFFFQPNSISFTDWT